MKRKTIYLWLGLLFCFLYFLSPHWLSISGVAPNWALLWLLPFALEEGPFLGLVAGLCCGLLVDSIFLEGVTQIPSFMLIGYSWGRVGAKGPLVEKSFNLGLLIFLGCFLNGLSIWLQNLFFAKDHSLLLLNATFFHTLLAQSIITCLIAPMSCSWALLTFFRYKGSKH